VIGDTRCGDKLSAPTDTLTRAGVSNLDPSSQREYRIDSYRINVEDHV
jgi:hypothetical protein